mgnify:CR=1 FL=1
MEVKKTLKYTSYPMHNIHLQLYTTYRSNKSFQSRTVDDRRKKSFFVLLRQLQTLDHWVHSMSFSHHHHHVWWQRKTKKIFQLSLRKEIRFNFVCWFYFIFFPFFLLILFHCENFCCCCCCWSNRIQVCEKKSFPNFCNEYNFGQYCLLCFFIDLFQF